MTQQNVAIKLTSADTKRWKNSDTRQELELELLSAGAAPGALVRDQKNAVLGRLTGGQVHDVPAVAGGMAQPAQRAGAPHHAQQPAATYGTTLTDTRTMQQPAPIPASSQPPPVQFRQLPPPAAPPASPVVPAAPAAPPGPIAKRAAVAVAEELRAARALNAEAQELGQALGMVGTGAEILAAVRIRLYEQDRELRELEHLTQALIEAESAVEVEERHADTEPPPPPPVVDHAIDGDG